VRKPIPGELRAPRPNPVCPSEKPLRKNFDAEEDAVVGGRLL
jgi:hypothetical protein